MNASHGVLQGKVALVTGGGSGIGRATAIEMAKEGASVAIADLNVEAAGETVAAIEASGGIAMPVRMDVADESSVRKAIGDIMGRFERLDCAFNNAGVSEPALASGTEKIADIAQDVWRRIMDVNVDGVWYCIRQEVAAMRRAGRGGVIVNNASVGGLVGLPLRGAYVASKHAVVGLTRAAAIDHVDEKIRVNAVCPGYVETRFSAVAMRTNGDAILGRIPVRRLGRPEEIAQMVVWLCSEKASFVTGAAMPVDGGYTAV